jgi:excisionase family DNA binding protein
MDATRKEPPMSETAEPKLLWGADAIAEYLGIPRRAVYHLIHEERIPIKKVGRTVTARPDRLLAALDISDGRAA